MRRGSRRLAPPCRIRWQPARECRRPKLMQRPRIHRAFEIDDFADRLPVVDPAPTIKFRLRGRIESKRNLFLTQSQEKPVLLLPQTKGLDVASHIARWQP